MRKQTLFGLAMTAALLGGADQSVYAQAAAGGAVTGAGGATSPAISGRAHTGINANTDMNAGANRLCADGTPAPAGGTCPKPTTRSGRAGASADTNVNANATTTTGAGAAARQAPTNRAPAPNMAAGPAAGGNATTNIREPNGANPPPVTGAAGAEANININVQQRTQIVDAIRAVRVPPATVDFSVRPGVVVPRHVRLHPLPSRLVRIVPRYRGYLFFMLADGRIVIVQPRSLRIVAII